MKRHITITLICSLLTTITFAQSNNIPNDWLLEGIKKPAKSVTHQSTSPYGVQHKTTEYTQDGYMHLVNMNYQLGQKEGFIRIKILPYENAKRYLLTMEKDSLDDLSKVNFNDIQTLPGLITQKQEWEDTHQMQFKSKKLQLTTNYLPNYQVASIESPVLNMPITYLSPAELKSQTIQPNVMYIVVTERDEFGSWTKRMSIQRGIIDDVFTTVEERNIEYYDILL